MAQLKVLLVDDEEELVVTLSKRLKLRGIDTEYVTSGEEAITSVHNKDYDAVILDINLPGIQGVELMDKIEEKKKDMKFILVTGYGDSHEVPRQMRKRAAFLLVKPVDIKDLVSKIEELCQQE